MFPIKKIHASKYKNKQTYQLPIEGTNNIKQHKAHL